MQWHIADSLRYSSVLRHLWGCIHGVRGLVSRNSIARLYHFTKALEFCEWRSAWHPLVQLLNRECHCTEIDRWQHAVMGKPRYLRLISGQPHITRSLVIKEPRVGGEKGAILIYFEYNLARLLKLSEAELKWLDQHFHVLLLASWSPTDYALLILAAERMKGPVFVQPANDREREKLSLIHPGIKCLPGLACDWIDPKFYQPKPMHDRSIDLLMVANWGAFKRHWEFFLALRHLPPGLKVVLVGQQESGRDRNYILDLARAMGVPQDLSIRESLKIEEVTALQCDARVSVILSRREGGCVAAVESLFAGCGLAMRAGAHVGSSAHIGPQTGRWLTPGNMSEDLAELLENSERIASREWAVEHIRHDRTLERINSALMEHDKEAGRPWTGNLAVLHFRPYPALVFSADRERLKTTLNVLNAKFPGVFPSNLQ